ncbi:MULTISPECIES: hypothetical protein [Pseudomonadota]|mgnify:CR=1 FL=1|uniref:Bbp19 family protein n=1 Tax=Pseudomonadota TaxID=1224 RepID=UPI00086E1A63|nr:MULTISPECIES: hypothetical protein [Pseudomonadota]MBN9253215.1 hypothetical protein [Mesorhizobium sp.]ODT17838.1 MAG: hypothetical protein ABS57_07420 [Mesorhizobium sp. SCN 65-12]ODU97935.1 MAG: hypothetical protein ABT24_03600 [Thiomonas sp. SCN 64-16]OJX82315.1 MAG: hypothetical protein BGO93_24275 [Mesorhizobium sp. 65-26]
MSRKRFARPSDAGGPLAARAALAKAYARVFSGEDGEMVLADLTATTGYYRRPSYGDWLARTKTPEGFELHSALSNARAEVVRHIMDQLMLEDGDLAALEKAARAEER